MKVALTLLVFIAIAVILFYVSGFLFTFFLGLFVGFLAGIPTGSALNDWFETTRFHKWRKKRREEKFVASL